MTNSLPPAPLKIGILGAANIARAFVRGVHGSTLIKVSAVASRDLAKARAFIQDLSLDADGHACTAHGSYEALLHDADVDAVYIPLPNHLHAQWAIAAARAGKHILCEKPLAMSAEETDEMFRVARECGVQLVEAYPYRAQPQTQKVKSLLRADEIGKVHTVQAHFGVTFTDPADIRLDPARGGGALWDLGSYTSSFIRLVSGARPTRVFAKAQWGETGIDRTVVGILEHADGVLAQFSCSFSTSYHRHALIAGDRGSIETRWLNHPPLGGPASIELRRGVPADALHETLVTETVNGFKAEAESFARLISEGEAAWTGATPQESFDIMSTIEALQASIRSGEWVAPKASRVFL